MIYLQNFFLHKPKMIITPSNSEGFEGEVMKGSFKNKYSPLYYVKTEKSYSSILNLITENLMFYIVSI